MAGLAVLDLGLLHEGLHLILGGLLALGAGGLHLFRLELDPVALVVGMCCRGEGDGGKEGQERGEESGFGMVDHFAQSNW